MVNPGIARLLTQVVLTGGRIVIRAVGDAYKVAAANSAVNALNANATSADRLTRITGMSFDEAKRILDVEKNDKLITMEDIEKKYAKLFESTAGSFYLQSKVFRAKERIELELKKGTNQVEEEEAPKA